MPYVLDVEQNWVNSGNKLAKNEEMENTCLLLAIYLPLIVIVFIFYDDDMVETTYSNNNINFRIKEMWKFLLRN